MAAILEAHVASPGSPHACRIQAQDLAVRDSMYQGWRHLPSDVQYRDVTVTGGPAVGRDISMRNFDAMRRAEPVNRLLPRTIDWILALPPKTRPHLLAAKFARIANVLCAAWKDPALCQVCLDDFLTDRRGGRSGFPRGIVRELHLLRRYYRKLHPEQGIG